MDKPIDRRKLRKGVRQLEFEELVLLETDECVLFPNGSSSKYGWASSGGRLCSVHVLALERRIGPRPAGMFACHTPMLGGHPRHCMNYRHLRWDTPKSNTADTKLDGTMPRGVARHNAKLTDEEVRTIRSLRGVERQSITAARYGITQAAISLIQIRRNWAHLSDTA